MEIWLGLEDEVGIIFNEKKYTSNARKTLIAAWKINLYILTVYFFFVLTQLKSPGIGKYVWSIVIIEFLAINIFQEWLGNTDSVQTVIEKIIQDVAERICSQDEITFLKYTLGWHEYQYHTLDELAELMGFVDREAALIFFYQICLKLKQEDDLSSWRWIIARPVIDAEIEENDIDLL